LVKGQVLNAAEIADLYAGLEANCLNRYTHLLTGNSLQSLLLL